jgi:3-oxoadipate enol-lactonase
LILCDTAARLGPPEYWDARIEAVRAGGMSAIALAVLARWFTESFLSQFPTVIEQVRHVLANTPASGYIACCEAIRDMDQRASLSRIQAPRRRRTAVSWQPLFPTRATRNCLPRTSRISRRRRRLPTP